MQMNDLIPLLIIGVMVIIAIVFIRRMTSDQVEMIEEPNPEYLDQLAQGRTNFLNELLEHFKFAFVLTDEESQTPVVEVVGDQIHRVTLASQDQIFTILIDWDRSLTISCYRNKEIKGKELIWTRKKFALKQNCINWKKVDKYLYDTLEKFMAITEEDKAFKDILAAAVEVAKEVNDDYARELLYAVAENYPWTGKKMKQRDSIKYYTSLLAYIFKFHKEEFVQYIKRQEDSE